MVVLDYSGKTTDKEEKGLGEGRIEMVCLVQVFMK